MADLIPNEGSFFTPQVDEERQRRLDKERSEVKAILPMLKKTIEWFELQAQECEKITAIDLEHPTLSAQEQIHGMQVCAEVFRKKKGEFQSYLNTYEK